MKKLITILAITSLFSFQVFAQTSLTSDSCNPPDSTCQAFELGANAQVLQDFSLFVTRSPSLGKVRRGEHVIVDYSTDGDRGKRYGTIDVVGEMNTLYQISCNAESSIMTLPAMEPEPLIFVSRTDLKRPENDVSYKSLDSCELQRHGDTAVASSLSSQQIVLPMLKNTYDIKFEINIGNNAGDGTVSGNIHIEVAYE